MPRLNQSPGSAFRRLSDIFFSALSARALKSPSGQAAGGKNPPEFESSISIFSINQKRPEAAGEYKFPADPPGPSKQRVFNPKIEIKIKALFN